MDVTQLPQEILERVALCLADAVGFDAELLSALLHTFSIDKPLSLKPARPVPSSSPVATLDWLELVSSRTAATAYFVVHQ